MSNLASYSVIFGTGLIYVGSALATGTSVALIYQAFKESFAWGLACVLFPLSSLIFLIRFWHDTKAVAYGQLLAVFLVVGGFGLQMVDPGYRTQYTYLVKTVAGWDEEAPKGGKSRAKKAANREEDFAALERKAALEDERRRRTSELFLMAQAWHAELVKKQPGPEAGAEAINAFNKEHANYQALLGEYKSAAAEFQAPQPPAAAQEKSRPDR